MKLQDVLISAFLALNLFLSVFAAETVCTHEAIGTSLSEQLWKTVLEEQIEDKATVDGYFLKAKAIVSELLEDGIPISCEDCTSLTSSTAEALKAEFAKTHPWKSHWETLSDSNKLFELILPIVARITHRKSPDSYNDLLERTGLYETDQHSHSSCRHLAELMGVVTPTQSDKTPTPSHGSFTITNGIIVTLSVFTLILSYYCCYQCAGSKIKSY
ncbi:MAG: hypothetical protein ACR2PT_01015 [Endozoicomonas sp.]